MKEQEIKKYIDGKLKTYWTHHMSHYIFEDLVQKVYNVEEYYFLEDMEIYDGDKSFIVTKGSLSDGEEIRLADFIHKGKCNFTARVLLKDLANKGYLPEGHYVING